MVELIKTANAYPWASFCVFYAIMAIVNEVCSIIKKRK